jgi:hypothetical protein
MSGTLDSIFPSPRLDRKRSRSFGQFTNITQRQASASKVKSEPERPYVRAMPHISTIEQAYLDVKGDLDSEIEEALLKEWSAGMAFFSADNGNSATPLRAGVDDRLQEQINATARMSAASTSTITFGTGTPANGKAFDASDDEEEVTRPIYSAPYNNPSKKTRARFDSEVIDDTEEEGAPPPKKQLRKRTVTQEHPYQADKVRHAKSKANGGRQVDSSEVEEEILSTQRKGANRTKSKAKAPAKANNRKLRDSTGRLSSVNTSQSPSPIASSPAPTLDNDRVSNNTVLMTWLAGNDVDAVPIPLAQCPDLESLFDRISSTWGQKEGRKVVEIRYILPWKAEVKMLMCEGWDMSFEYMIKEIHRAPAWRKKGDTNTLEVKLEVTLE